MSNIEKLIEKQKQIEKERKAINIAIRKAMEEENKRRYEKVGQEMEKLFKADPTCSDSQKISSICSKYFSPKQEPESQEKDLPESDELKREAKKSQSKM